MAKTITGDVVTRFQMFGGQLRRLEGGQHRICPQVSFSWIGSLGQSALPHSSNPFAYIARAVAKFDSVGLGTG